MGIQSSTIQAGRRFHELLMDGTCEITQVLFKTLNPITGVNVDTIAILYDGPCKIRIAAASAGIMEREPLGQAFSVQESILSLPLVAGTADITSDATVEILTNNDDPTMVGRKFRVKKYSVQSSATARRLVVEDIN